MPSILQRLFRRVRLRPFELTIELGQGADGRHTATVYKRSDAGAIPVTDLRALLRAEYRETSDDGRTVYTVSDEDRQTLLSLKSLNPEIREDGTLAFDVLPSVLQYLRKQENTSETPASQTVQVRHERPVPAAHVEYDPQSGVTVRAGYHVDGVQGIIRADHLPEVVDEDYMRFGNTFVRRPEPVSQKAEEFLGTPSRTIPFRGVPEFFLRDLVLLRSEFKAVLDDGAQRIRIIDKGVQPVVRVDAGPGGWLDFEVTYEGGGVGVGHRDLAQSDGGYFCPDDYTWVYVRPEQIRAVNRRLGELGAIPTENGYRVPAQRFASLEEFIESIGGREEAGQAYRDFLARLTGFAANSAFRLPEAAESQLTRSGILLRPYQRAGIHWLNWLRVSHLHGVLADDMGLGKTIQAICALRFGYESSRSEQHSLVLCPKSVMLHWEREIQRCFPEMPTYVYHGTAKRPQVFGARHPIIFITTYATAANDAERLAGVPFFYLILDEATRIKNPDAQRSQAVKTLNATHRLALSGTPVENRPAELWSIFDFLMRGHLGKYGTFVSTYENRIMAGDVTASQGLGRRILPFLLRRTKKEVAKDLPEKIDVNEWCELTAEQRRLYGTLQDQARGIIDSLKRGEYVNYTSTILPVLTKLKQICDHPALITRIDDPLQGRSEKFDWIVEKVQEIASAGEQVVLFSHYLRMLDLLQEGLRRSSISWIRLDGSTNNRQQLIDSFTYGHAQVALCSLMAAGYGINLMSANHVIHADRWWNPAVEDQATDRVHRIGQDKTVYVYRILVQGTLEERIDRLLANKRGMADRIVGAAQAGARAWTADELVELLRPLD